MSVMSQLDLLRQPEEPWLSPRCGCCGTTEAKSGVPITTVVVDFRTELMCDKCVARHDWSDWIFDPILNLYVHT
jgi:hypothetical protein